MSGVKRSSKISSFNKSSFGWLDSWVLKRWCNFHLFSFYIINSNYNILVCVFWHHQLQMSSRKEHVSHQVSARPMVVLQVATVPQVFIFKINKCYGIVTCKYHWIGYLPHWMGPMPYYHFLMQFSRECVSLRRTDLLAH